MKRVVLMAIVAALSLSLPALDVEAKRLGGGGSAGMKRTAPPPAAPAQNGTPPTQAAPQQQAAAPAPGPAAAPKRSWMGPIAGLAAGLGLAALASHFGFGGALANVMTMVLLAGAAVLLIGFVMRRFGAAKASAPQGMAYAGASAGAPAGYAPPVPPVAAATPAPTAAATSANGFDAAGFEQIAKRVFIRLQAANDAGDQADLRRFTTPEMYGHVQQELLERKGGAQRTDVLQLDARVIEQVEEDGQQIVSVRFWGLIREQSEAAAENFDEVWHLVRPLDGSREWAIAGIQATV
ncbi:MAG: Tim44-like domain-containing protein [Burkholderiaceae bacterium]